MLYGLGKKFDSNIVLAEDIVWFNGGVYLSTLIFLGLGLFFAVLSALFGIYNGSKSPIEPIWGVFGTKLIYLIETFL
jgi:hypothetical protein